MNKKDMIGKIQAITEKAKLENRGFTDAEVAERDALKKNVSDLLAVEAAEQEDRSLAQKCEQAVTETRANRPVGGKDEAEVRMFQDIVFEKRDYAVGSTGFQLPTTINSSILNALQAINGLAANFPAETIQGFAQYDAFGDVTSAWVGEGVEVTAQTPSSSSFNLTPHALASMGKISERAMEASAAGFEQAFVQAFVDSIAKNTDIALWSGTGSNMPEGLAYGSGIDGALTTSSLTVSTGSIVVTQLAQAVTKVDAAYVYDLVAVIPNNVVGVLAGFTKTDGSSLNIVTAMGNKRYLNTGLGTIEIISPIGVTGAVTAGSVLGVLCSKREYKRVRFGGGAFRYKKLAERFATSLQTGHLVWSFEDAKIGRKAAFVKLIATA